MKLLRSYWFGAAVAGLLVGLGASRLSHRANSAPEGQGQRTGISSGPAKPGPPMFRVARGTSPGVFADGMAHDLRGLSRSDAYDRLVGLSTDELAALAARLRGIDSMSHVFTSVVERWAERKPLAAWKMVLTNHGPPEALISVMRLLADRNPQTAREALAAAPAFLRDLEQPAHSSGHVFNRLLVQLARHDADGACAIARQGSGHVRSFLPGFLEGLAAESPAAAARLAEGLEANDARDRAAEGIVTTWATSDPSAALEWGRKWLPSARYRGFLESVIRQSIGRDPSSLVEAVAQLPAGEQRPKLCETISGKWVARDADACLEWARALEDPAERAAALHAAARQLSSSHPAEALALVNELPDPRVQRSVATAAIRKWAETDRYAASAFAQTIPDPHTREICLAAIPAPPTSRASPPPSPSSSLLLGDKPIRLD